MRTNLVICLIVVLAVLYAVYNRCSVTCQGSHKRSNFRGMTFNATGICSDAAGDGADAAFISACTSYQTICGEDSTSTAVHQINGEYGLNSSQADTAMQTLLSNVKTAGCCNPSNQDASNCTGN